MNFHLTEKQQQGLDICLKRYREKESFTIIAGYAGTGKSYLVNAIVETLGLKENEVAYASYTGKAALVLQKQGKNAITLHKLLYTFYPNGYGGFIIKPKKFLDSSLKLIIVDEISMCPKEIWNLLLSHKIYIIGLGDPFQLPPIGDDLHLLEKPHIFLTEIMRQALDNDIIEYSLKLRQGEKLYSGVRGKNIRTYKKTELVPEMLTWADQILCGKNNTRRQINNQVRKILNKTNIVDENDKLICLKNYWDFQSSQSNFLVNGTIGYLNNIKINESNKKIRGNFFVNDLDSFGTISLDYKLLKTGEPTIKKLPNGKILPKSEIEMDYGYTITVHKAQGSQFNKVLVFDEHLWQEENHNRWLYTAITRAIDKVVILI